MKTRTLLFILMFISCVASGQIIHVPGDQPSIQAGINAAGNGDTVLVAEDTYYENIRFMGKAITVASHYIMDGDTNHINNTIIDGSQPLNPDTAAVVMFLHGEDTTSILNGFTITGGTGIVNQTWQFKGGGGIYAAASGAKIVNNKITNNSVEYAINAGGAGLHFYFFSMEDKWAVVENNIISHNHSIAYDLSAFGAGIWSSINIIIRNNTIEHNTCTNSNQITDGGGIEVESVPGMFEPSALIENNIIRYNVCSGNTSAQGAGFMSISSSCILKNNTFTHNSAIATDGAASGGGFYINDVDSGCLVQGNIVRYNTIEGNTGYGGGARIRICGYAEVVDNEFCANTINSFSSGYGGGLIINRPPSVNKITGNLMSDNVINEHDGYSYGGGCCLYRTDTIYLSFADNILERNTAGHGGALYCRNAYNISMCNNIFEENTSAGQGGAIRFWHNVKKDNDDGLEDRSHHTAVTYTRLSADYHPFVANNNFINNIGGQGGAVYSNYSANMPIYLNCIFWGNEATASNEIYNSEITAKFNLSNCDIDTNEIRGSWSGSGNFDKNPMFEDDQCHLAWYSPCVGSGSDSILVGDSMYCCPAYDYEGDPRPSGSYVDVGADESPFWVSVSENHLNQPGLKLKINPNPSSGALHLRYLILDTRYLIFEVYSADGVKVKTLFSGKQAAGEHTMNADLSDLPDGLYFIRLQAGKEVETAKLVLIK